MIVEMYRILLNIFLSFFFFCAFVLLCFAQYLCFKLHYNSYFRFKQATSFWLIEKYAKHQHRCDCVWVYVCVRIKDKIIFFRWKIFMSAICILFAKIYYWPLYFLFYENKRELKLMFVLQRNFILHVVNVQVHVYEKRYVRFFFLCISQSL